jgi:hypothetical protein
MASAFNIELSMSESPAEAQAHAADAFNEPASAIGLRLTERGAGELKYRRLVQWPFLVVLWRYLNGEKMTVKFEPADGGGTRVTVNGAAARGKHPLATDPGHWATRSTAQRRDRSTRYESGDWPALPPDLPDGAGKASHARADGPLPDPREKVNARLHRGSRGGARCMKADRWSK